MRAQGSQAGDRQERQSSRHLLYRLEGCRYQERKGSRRRRREREREGKGGRKDWDDDRTKAQRSSLCQPGDVRLCPRPPHPPQSPSMPRLCFRYKFRAPSSAATGALRGLASAGTPRGGMQGEETASPTRTSRRRKEKKPDRSLPLCVGTIGSRRPERGSLRTMSSLPPLPSLRGNVGVEVI